jgi:hypothetical protein
MTKHLSGPQFVDALDARVAPDVQTHLDRCVSCAEQLAGLRDTMTRAAEQRDVPEPSPLFWDHFSARVREAVSAEPAPVPFWVQWWRPIVALGAMAAVAAFVVWMRVPPAPQPGQPVAATASTSATDSGAALASTPDGDDMPWNLIVALASDLSHEDLHEVVPTAHGVAGMVEDLTPEQRAAFVQLVKREMGGTE